MVQEESTAEELAPSEAEAEEAEALVREKGLLSHSRIGFLQGANML